MKRQKYEVELSTEEQKELKRIKGSKSAKELTKTNAKALLLLDENNPKKLTPELTAKRCKPHLKQMWCIPPHQNADFVAKMEDVLDVYALPYDEKFPVVCIDEKPYQLLDERRKPLDINPGSPGKIDNEYERCGTSAIFVMVEPLKGQFHANARERRTAVDYAYELASNAKNTSAMMSPILWRTFFSCRVSVTNFRYFRMFPMIISPLRLIISQLYMICS